MIILFLLTEQSSLIQQTNNYNVDMQYTKEFKRGYKTEDIDRFYKDLSKEDWMNTFGNTDLNSEHLF